MNTDSTISVLILNWSTSQLCLSHQSHEPQINMQLKRVLQVNQSWISKGKLVKKWVIQEMMCWISCSNIISGKKQCQRLQDAKTWAENLLHSEWTERYWYYFSSWGSLVFWLLSSTPGISFPLLASTIQVASTHPGLLSDTTFWDRSWWKVERVKLMWLMLLLIHPTKNHQILLLWPKPHIAWYQLLDQESFCLHCHKPFNLYS